MENATKALEIAAGVLFGLMILGALMFTYEKISDSKQMQLDVKEESQATDFNADFEQYNSNNVYGTELVSLANKIMNYNKVEAEKKGYTEMTMTVNFKSIPTSLKSAFGNRTRDISVDQISNGYNSLLSKIKEISTQDVKAPDNTKKTVIQWSKSSESSLNEAFNNKIDSKITSYLQMVSDQTDFVRKSFFGKVSKYDETGRIISFQFDEK